MKVLDAINSPADIKKLSVKELGALCGELRDEIISTAKNNGGHLSSNLGIVETTVALNYVFDFPKDKLIFDVGHQCYAHKILTGRKDVFGSIRLSGGLSGFPDREESEYDAFTTGHAGTSIAAGLGYCKARDFNKENYAVIDVVGDGSFVNGLNLEALTASEVKPKNYLVILNDNEMSISKNSNALYRLLSQGTTKNTYLKGKNFIKRLFGNSFLGRFLRKIERGFKRILGAPVVYENFGFKYVGIVNGNDISGMVKTLARIKSTIKYKPVFLHIKTTKGKGYSFTEEHSDTYHGIGKNFISKSGGFAKKLGEIINEKISAGENVFAITAAMKDGTGLSIVEKEHKDRFIDVGIAEEYAVTLAAGMAAGGIRPIVAVYSTFMQRAYDQILHDVCLDNLPVIFCLDRSGLVGADGKTHQGVFDLSYLTHLPNMSVYAPSDYSELEEIMDIALKSTSPVAIRYPVFAGNGERPTVSVKDFPWRTVKEGDALTIIAEGPRMTDLAEDVAEKFGARVIEARRIKPLDNAVLDKIDTPIVVLEENSKIGGFGSLILGRLSETGANNKTIICGVGDAFVKHGSIEDQLDENGLSVDAVSRKIKEKFGLKELNGHNL